MVEKYNVLILFMDSSFLSWMYEQNQNKPKYILNPLISLRKKEADDEYINMLKYISTTRIRIYVVCDEGVVKSKSAKTGLASVRRGRISTVYTHSSAFLCHGPEGSMKPH